MNNMFDRETQREKNLEKAMKEARMKAKKEATRKDEVRPPGCLLLLCGGAVGEA